MARASPRWSGQLLLAVLLAFLAAGAAGTRPRPPQPGRAATTARRAGDETYRLPGAAFPTHYDIHIEPTLAASTFEGFVDIYLKARETSPKLVLHGDSLKIVACTINGTALEKPAVDLERQFLTFDVEKAGVPLRPDESYVLHCHYNGKIWHDDKGFYLSSYKENGTTKQLGVTQFEMTFARRAFPAFDEPGFRSTFALSLTHFSKLRAVSNTRPSVISVVDKVSGKVTTTFETTPRMACYTLAWLLSEMPCKDNRITDFRTFAPPTLINETATSQTLGPQVLTQMAKYTGIPYAMDKMDQVALPDFNFGAMENWGLVTYREDMLLEGDSSRTFTRLTVATTIAHELAHQWFGNLVTPSWWSHVWLSEAFAELFCYIMVDQAQPDWNVMDKMPLLEMQDAFVEDAFASSNPMTNMVYTPDQILGNFGSVTYAKGSSVMRMLRQYVGERTFQVGIQYYLNKMMLTGSVQPDDLWDGLAQAVSDSGAEPSTDLRTVAKSWTDTAGYPVVTVSVNGTSLNFNQNRFMWKKSSDLGPEWQVPIVWQAEGLGWMATGNGSFILGTMEDTAADALKGESVEYVLANVDQIGYYRVNYEESNWKALTAKLVRDANTADTFSTATRAMLVDDALSLARAGLLDYRVALPLTEYLTEERDYAPWAAFENAIDYVAMFFRTCPKEDKAAFNNWVQSLVHKRYDDLSLSSGPDDAFEDKLTRTVVARLAMEAEFLTAEEDAELRYLDWTAGSWNEPDTLRLVLCHQLQVTGSALNPPDALFDDLLQRLTTSDDEAAKQDYTYALGCAPQTDAYPLKQKLLTALFNPKSGIKLRDFRALWKSLSSTDDGLTLALDAMISNFRTIEKNYGVGEVVSIFATLAKRIVLQSQFTKLSEFCNGDGAELDGLSAVLDTIQINLDWGYAHYEDLLTYFKQAVPTTMRPTPTQPTTKQPTQPTGPTPTTNPTPSPTTNPTPSPTTNPTPSPTTNPTPNPTTNPTTTPTPTSTPTPTPDTHFRLPVDKTPSLYLVTLVPNMTDKTFSGTVDIELKAVQSDTLDVIVLHASGLQFEAKDVNVSEVDSGRQIKVSHIVAVPDAEQVFIHLESALTPVTVSYTVFITYTGPLRDDLTGLYMTDFGNGTMVGAQLFPAYARRAMPCLDEPMFRAPMYLTVLRGADQVAISNTPSIGAEPMPEDPSTVVESFEPTEAIAASQLSLVVADAALLTRIPADEDTDSLVTVHGLPDVVAKANETVSTALQLLSWFTNATGTAGGLEHLSVVGVDHNLDDGAAAWGLVALRSSDLANLDASPSAGESEQAWLTQLGRGLSQLWFGNLVGLEWWDAAWLRQGFATYYQYAAAHALQPRWQLQGQLYTRAVAPALHADAVEGVRALGGPVTGSQASIAEALDAASSGKGAAVVQMLQQALEQDDAFNAGLNKYFATNAENAADADALLSAMAAAAQQYSTSPLPSVGLTAAFRTWTDAAGYPVITVIRDYENKRASITQERFLLHATSPTSAAGRWWVPVAHALKTEYLNMKDALRAPVKTWLDPGQTTAVVDLAADDDAEEFLLANVDRRGFYRVNYDAHNWLLLKRYLNEYHTLLEPVARAMLVDDALTLARAGRLEYPYALGLVDYLRLDMDLVPWEAARQAFDYLDAQFLESSHEAVYKTWLLQLLDRAFQEAGFQPEESDTHVQRLTRGLVTSWACDAGHERCARLARADFDKWLQDSDSVAHDTLAAAVCEGARGTTDAAVVDAVLAKLAAEAADWNRAAIVQGLGCADKDVVAARVLGLATAAGLRKGEAALLYKAASRHGPSSVTSALGHYKTNALQLVQAYGQGAAFDVFAVLAGRTTTTQQVNTLEAVAATLGNPDRLQGLLGLAQANVRWQTDNLDNVSDIVYALINPDYPTTAAPTAAPTTAHTSVPTKAPTTAPGPTPNPKPTKVPNGTAGALGHSVAVLLATLLATFAAWRGPAV